MQRLSGEGGKAVLLFGTTAAAPAQLEVIIGRSRSRLKTATERNSGLLSGSAKLRRCCGVCTIYSPGPQRVWRNRTDNSVAREERATRARHAHAAINSEESRRGAARARNRWTERLIVKQLVGLCGGEWSSLERALRLESVRRARDAVEFSALTYWTHNQESTMTKHTISFKLFCAAPLNWVPLWALET